tara:strand:- start:13510 stop:13692 length:183 start_codon:yes stop_codon:yes gene_type:complete
MKRVSQVIILLTLGWLLGASTIVALIKMNKKEPVPTEPVVCIVKLQSGPIGTHNFKGVVK